MPVVFYLGYNSMSLDFNEFDKMNKVQKYTQVENNINEIGSCILTLFRQYKYALMKKSPKSALVDQVLKTYKNNENKEIKVYGPCVLLPYNLVDF